MSSALTTQAGWRHFSRLISVKKDTRGEFFALDDLDLDEAEQLAKLFAESAPIRERVELLRRERDDRILIEPLEAHRELVERWRLVKAEFARIKLEKE